MNSTLTLEQVIEHARNRSYMDGIQRDSLRVKQTQEVFTPTDMVKDLLDQLPQELFADASQTVIDNSCGDGQFLSEALIRKLENGLSFEDALGSIRGVDMMQDNVDKTRERLLCGREDLRYIVEQNIVCHNALTYNYNFGNSITFGNGLFEEE
jgi:type I restriction-modification system DNA methylase subunit